MDCWLRLQFSKFSFWKISLIKVPSFDWIQWKIRLMVTFFVWRNLIWCIGFGICPENFSCSGIRSCTEMGIDVNPTWPCSEFRLCHDSGSCSDIGLCNETRDCQATCVQSKWYMFYGTCNTAGKSLIWILAKTFTGKHHIQSRSWV